MFLFVGLFSYRQFVCYSYYTKNTTVSETTVMLPYSVVLTMMTISNYVFFPFFNNSYVAHSTTQLLDVADLIRFFGLKLQQYKHWNN